MSDNMKTTPVVSENEKPELIGQIIDLFEDFLADKNIQIENQEKDDPNVEEDTVAIIYGSDYGILQDGLEDILHNWNITN